MGAIFSRPVNYVKQKINQKVEDTKTAIRTRIDNTKNAIYTKVDNTKTAITTRIDNTKNAITTRVSNTTNAICTRVTNTRDGIVSRANKVKQATVDFKDGVVTRVTNVCTAVKTRYIATKEATITAYTTVKTKCINTKNAIHSKYTSTKNKIADTYHRVRNAKLTRAQKIKYGLLLTFILIWLLIGFIILLDLYLGDYEAANWKVEAVKAFWCYLGTLLLQILTNCLHYTKAGGEYAWEGTKVGSEYAWAGMKICGAQIWEASLIGGEYVLYGAQVCGEYILYGTKLGAENIYHGLKVGAQHTTNAALVGMNYTAEGAKVAFEYGSYGVKEGAIYMYEGTKYALINLAIGSYHAGIQLIHVTRMCVWGLLTGSYSGSAMLMDGTTFIANKTYHGSIAATNYTCIAATKLWEWGGITVAFISHWSVVGTGNLWKIVSESAIYTYETVVSGSIFLWESLCSTCAFVYKWTLISVDKVVTTTVAVATFIYTWGYYIIVNGSKGLYYGLNQFGLKWLLALSQAVAKWSGVLGTIFLKFFTDLGMYLWNFIYVTSMHIYNVLYIIFSFLYNILSGIMGLVRVNVDGVVYVVKLIFRGIIWVLEETLVGYYYMLNKYNNYREYLFLGFLALITFYCTGLIRDRRQSLDSDSEDDDDEAEELIGKGREIKRKGSDLPPIYEHPELPDYNDSSEDEFHFDSDNEMNLDGVLESDEAELEEESHQLRERKRAERISIGHEDSDALSDDSLETPSGESDREKIPSAPRASPKVIKKMRQGTSPQRKADLEADADDEDDPSDNDIDPESLSDAEQEDPTQEGDVEGIPEDKPLYDRVAALIQTPQSDCSSRVSTPGSDFFAGHNLETLGSIDSPASESVGTPASDFFAGHDLQSPGELDSPSLDSPSIESPGELDSPGDIGTPASDTEPSRDRPYFPRSENIDIQGRSITPASDASNSFGTPASDFFAGHHLGTPASDSVGTPASDFFAGHHLETPGSLGTPASGMDTPDSDFFAGHNLPLPSRLETPGSDFSIGTPNSDIERRGRRIFEHGLEGQSDLDSLEALPVTDSDPDSPVKSIRRSSLKKKISSNVSVSDEESGDADCDSDPETERTLKERVNAIKSRKKGFKEQLMAHVDSDNVESPMSPTSPLSPGSMDDERSCDTDSLQNLLVSESGDEADDSLRISSNMSDDVCEDSLGEDEPENRDDLMSTDSIPAGMGALDNKGAQSHPTSPRSEQTFDNQANLNAVFDGRSELLATEILPTSFDNTLASQPDPSKNDNHSASVSTSDVHYSKDLGPEASSATSLTTTSDNGHNIPASRS